jgi:hypothetical protein
MDGFYEKETKEEKEEETEDVESIVLEVVWARRQPFEP